MKTAERRQALAREHSDQLLDFQRQHPFRYYMTVVTIGGLLGAFLLYALYLLSKIPSPFVTP